MGFMMNFLPEDNDSDGWEEDAGSDLMAINISPV